MTATSKDDKGFTLIELLVAMTIIGMLAAMTIWGIRSWQFASEQDGTAGTLTSELRQVQEQAISNGTTYCVRFNADDTYQLFQYSCTVMPVPVGGVRSPNGAPRVHLIAPSFLQNDSSTQPWVIFSPRGTATAGSLTVTRDNSPKTYTVTVEGLTGRVSYR